MRYSLSQCKDIIINIHKNRYTPYNIEKYEFSYHIAIKMFIFIAWIGNFIQMLQTTYHLR